MKRLLGLYLFFCFALCPAAFGQYRFDNWTTDDGLPQNGVREITQTPDGYLWFTTFDGLVRFDGVRFTTFNKSNTKGIINNRFAGLFEDTDGTLYATTAEDGVLTIYRNGVFSSMTADEVPGSYINKIEKGADGELLFSTIDEDRKGKSTYHLKNGKFEFVEKRSTDNLDVFLESNNGTKWLVTPRGVTETKGQTSRFIPLDMTRANFRPNIFDAKDGSLWIGENYVHHVRDGNVTTYDEKDGLPNNTIYHSAWQEANGSVWFSSGGGSSTGVGLLQFKDDKLSIWGKDDGFKNRLINSVFHDREGNVWLATDRGLSRRRNQIIQGYSTADGLDHTEIYPIYRDSKDTIWVGSSKGLTTYRDGKFQRVDLRSPESEDHSKGVWRPGAMSIQALWEDPSGKMWVGVDGGLFLVHDGLAESLMQGIFCRAIKNDRFGNVWVATSTGVYRFNDNKLTAKYSTKDGLPNDSITTIHEDAKGTLWFGSYGGISKFEDGRFTNYSRNDGLAGNYVRTIYEDTDGTLWIGTYDEGLSRFKDGKFVTYRESDGLYNSGVFAIEEDEAGNFWISSNRGIYRVKKSELNDFADRKIARINSVSYGTADGMLSNECNGGRQPSSVRDKDGKFWFPTQDGVAIVDPLAEQPNPLPPSVVVEEVLVERRPVDFRSGISIEAGQKDLEIRYTGISLIKSEQIKFQYMLEGHDAGWIDAGTRRTANYSYLPPGEYTFLVKAANSDGVWSENAGVLKVELRSYFYQTTMFYLFTAFCAAIALLIVWKVSVHQLESREKKLTRLVAERTAALAKANEDLQSLANSDGLTKIGNRRRFESFLDGEWHRAVRAKTQISLVMIDIDHFKLFNDTYGHQAGDECLQKVAEALSTTIKRPSDLVARFGGEEFAMILGGTDAAGAKMLAEQAIESIRKIGIKHSGSATSEILTVSVGIATLFATFEKSEADLISIADRALYQAKKNGRNGIFVSGHFGNLPGPKVGDEILAEEILTVDQG